MATKRSKKREVTLPRSVKKLFPEVEFAFDADKPVEISVEPRDCRDGRKLMPTECALARAARRELKADSVIIGMSTSYVIRGNTAIRFATPQSVAREIVSFDRNQDFAPGDYHLAVKAPTNKLGTYQTRNHGGGSKEAKRKVHHSARVRVLAKGSE